MPADGFDPYHKWLGIPPEEQPPNHYRLLGLVTFEADREVIANAVGRQTFHLRQHADGPQAALAQRLLKEVGAAKLTLLNPEAKTKYDQSLAPDASSSVTEAVPLPTFRRKPVKAKGRKSVPTSLLVRIAPSVLIGAVLLMLFYFSERKVNPTRSGSVATTPISSLPLDGTGDGEPALASRAADSLARAANAGEASAVSPDADANAGRTDPDVILGSDAGAMEADAATDESPLPSNVAVTDSSLPSDKEARVAGIAAAAEMPPETAAGIDLSKGPVPGANEQSQARKSVRSKHKAEFAKAKTADDRLALAKALLVEARNMDDRSPKRYALFALAIDQAAVDGNFSLAADGWNDLADIFQVDALAGRWETLEKSSKTKQVDSLRAALRQLIDDATEMDRYELARGALKMLAASDPSEADQCDTELKALDTLATLYGPAKMALEKLKIDSADPQANQTAGEFLSFGKRDWSAGLLLLSRSDDATLKRLADAELAQPGNPQAQVRLADSWWDFADGHADQCVADSAKSRARFWYMEALPELTGDERAKAEKRATLEARVHHQAAPELRITAQLLSSKLKGNASYDAQANELTLVYDFQDDSQRQDFAGNATLTEGEIHVSPGNCLRHVVQFRTLRMIGAVAMKSNAGDVIRGSGGLRAQRDASAVKITWGKDTVGSSENGPPDDRLTLPFELDANEKLVLFRLGDQVVGRPMAKSEPGQIELCGGEAGAQFSRLVISGQPDPAWMAEFFDLPKIDSDAKPPPATSAAAKAKPTLKYEQVAQVILWNEHNSGHNNSGARTCNLTLSRNGKTVWQKKELEVPWEPNQPTKLVVDVPLVVADSVRVEVAAWRGESGGLSEVEVLDKAGENLARGAVVIASAEHQPGDPRNGATLIDGITDSTTEKLGYWLAPNGLVGWADIRLLPQEAPPPVAKQPPATANKKPAKASGKHRTSFDAKIFACCDDEYELFMNGKHVLTGKGREAGVADVVLKAGDVITAKAINWTRDVGFCCAIKLSTGQTIATGDGWHSYTPADPEQWFTPAQASTTGPTINGDSEWVADLVKQASGVNADLIWAPEKQDVCYLVLVVGKLQFPKKTAGK